MGNRWTWVLIGVTLPGARVVHGQSKTVRDAVTGRELPAVELKTKRSDCRVGDGRVWIVTDRDSSGPKAMVSVWVLRPPLSFGDPPIVLRGDTNELLVVSDSGRWQRRGFRLDDPPSFQFHETIGKQEHALYGIAFADLDTLVTRLGRGEPTVIRIRGANGRCDLRVMADRVELLRSIMDWARDTARTP